MSSLKDQGALAERVLPDGRILAVWKMIYTYRLTMGQPGDMSGYSDSWCYETAGDAMAAMVDWDGKGEPQGWHRNPNTGRRRPDGEHPQVPSRQTSGVSARWRSSSPAVALGMRLRGCRQVG